MSKLKSDERDEADEHSVETIMTDETSEHATESERPESALTGSTLELSYPTSEEPVVECDRIDVPSGEITALVGPNGSGKSTLLKSLAKQLEPDAGRVYLDGTAIDEYDDKAFARELGLLSQQHDSPTSLSVEDLVYHGRYPHRGFFEQTSEEDRAAVERAIDLAGVEHIRDKQVGNLSGGQRQLAWIAMVLAQDTDVLLLDEPTTYLDLHHQLRVLETVRELNEERGVTVAVVLHDIAQAARFADYLVAMQDGELYDWGPPREVVTEELLADVFRVEAAVNYTPDPEIIPKHSL
ncbi:ABC transporter ATP-binding protein [Haloferax mediterranei ATCC 33500]|uniref:Cobalamin import ATP-binding protein BtuD n=3 Tax=Haloferacaceae TaxID=1644056 RepID=I3R5N1_HALMT|nr:iron/cobalamin ABC-type transporter ATP-binding protein [Haloferax mediterranei ATCC 33500]ELZ99861.1 iron/cobalamin ABC-type transporter ATP-binding protein [Haloferax mediterranei ATCC 33500]QCQ74200.1 ABC transporter ATP-binding protein [Haloferax mediterranei ATCC 33500]